MVEPVTRQDVAAARSDVEVFARLLVGERLWPHQAEVARSEARVRVVCSGRQAGKTRLLAVLALHTAFADPGRRVLVVSAGEQAAKGLLAEVVALVGSPLLAGSVVDDGAAQVVLSNGSTIRSVPASTKQIRGQSVDLLVIDEASFVDADIWSAARYTTIARPGSRVVLASTPWGGQSHWYATAFRAGQRGEEGFAAWHWPSTASPLVDESLLAIWRRSTTDREYRREVLAEWVDDSGAYFAGEDLSGAVVDYDLVAPVDARGRVATAGVDWGMVRDSSALVIMAEVGDGDLPVDRPPRSFYIPWLVETVGTTYASFIRTVADACGPDRYRLLRLVSETNGVGQMPTTELGRLVAGRVGRLVPLATTAATKEDSFGRLRLLVGQGRLVLPRHPRLLGQLTSLEFEERESGGVRISVPERAGHDDLAMALAMAVSETNVASSPARGRAESSAGVRLPAFTVGRDAGDTRFAVGGGRSAVRGVRRVIDPGDPALRHLPGPHR
jgi:hypothetical protein